MRIRVVGSVFAVLLSAGALASLGVSALEPVVLIPIDGEGSKYWSRWRGPSGQGTVTDTDYVVSSQQRVFAYDPDTGTELWTVRGNSREVIPTPVVGHGLVFCSSGRAGPTLAIKPGERGMSRLRTSRGRRREDHHLCRRHSCTAISST